MTLLSRRRIWLIAVLALLVLGAVVAAARLIPLIGQINFAGARGEGGIADVQVPPGFRVNVFAQGLNGPRFLTVGPDQVLYVADRLNDRIVALPDADSDGVADEVRVFAADIPRPHSVIYHEGAWYVGITSGVIRLEDSDGDGSADRRTTIIDDLPTQGQHSTRTVEFLPDGRLVVSVGSSCNVCEEEDARRAAVVVYDGLQGGGERILARGLRNAVGLAVHPQTGQLWATNNGRDLMGDDLPPETLYVVQDGADYGWPRCHSGRIEDPDYGYEGACEDADPPVVEMQAHSAPLGLTFYRGQAFPAEYRDDLFIAFHGSWNRSVLTGYKVVRLPFENGQPASQVEDFATGWLDEDTGEVSGRPVDVVVGADGALYVTDDKGGIVYRISY
jgi:glucose/arabinose dehydrogenase